MRHMVVTTDKTIVSGDILIDDKPEIKGKLCGVYYLYKIYKAEMFKE